MGEVVKPFGDYGTPGAVPEIVDRLKKLLEQAERGEINGFAWALVRPNGICQEGTLAGTAHCMTLLGTIALLHHAQAHNLNQAPDAGQV